jgi:hypothetical protein
MYLFIIGLFMIFCAFISTFIEILPKRKNDFNRIIIFSILIITLILTYNIAKNKQEQYYKNLIEFNKNKKENYEYVKNKLNEQQESIKTQINNYNRQITEIKMIKPKNKEHQLQINKIIIKINNSIDSLNNLL